MKIKLTQRQAQVLVDVHAIDEVLENEEERKLVEENNPELMEVYEVLMKIAKGEERQ